VNRGELGDLNMVKGDDMNTDRVESHGTLTQTERRVIEVYETMLPDMAKAFLAFGEALLRAAQERRLPPVGQLKQELAACNHSMEAMAVWLDTYRPSPAVV